MSGDDVLLRLTSNVDILGLVSENLNIYDRQRFWTINKHFYGIHTKMTTQPSPVIKVATTFETERFVLIPVIYLSWKPKSPFTPDAHYLFIQAPSKHCFYPAGEAINRPLSDYITKEIYLHYVPAYYRAGTLLKTNNLVFGYYGGLVSFQLFSVSKFGARGSSPLAIHIPYIEAI